MNHSLIGLAFAFHLLLPSIAGCGSQDPSADAGAGGEAGGAPSEGGTGPMGAILPLASGNTWTYRVTESDGTVSVKVQTVGAEEMVGGTGPFADRIAFRVSTDKQDGSDLTESWQALDGERVIRYRERAYRTGATGELELEEHWDPYKLRVDGTEEHSVTGASWLEIYQETKLPVGGQPISGEVRDRWSVVSDNERVEVPAGAFDGAIHYRKAGASNTKDYWYVRGVGKIKETGSQTEELESYEVAP